MLAPGRFWGRWRGISDLSRANRTAQLIHLWARKEEGQPVTEGSGPAISSLVSVDRFHLAILIAAQRVGLIFLTDLAIGGNISWKNGCPKQPVVQSLFFASER